MLEKIYSASKSMVVAVRTLFCDSIRARKPSSKGLRGPGVCLQLWNICENDPLVSNSPSAASTFTKARNARHVYHTTKTNKV